MSWCWSATSIARNRKHETQNIYIICLHGDPDVTINVNFIFSALVCYQRMFVFFTQCWSVWYKELFQTSHLWIFTLKSTQQVEQYKMTSGVGKTLCGSWCMVFWPAALNLPSWMQKVLQCNISGLKTGTFCLLNWLINSIMMFYMYVLYTSAEYCFSS